MLIVGNGKKAVVAGHNEPPLYRWSTAAFSPWEVLMIVTNETCTDRNKRKTTEIECCVGKHANA